MLEVVFIAELPVGRPVGFDFRNVFPDSLLLLLWRFSVPLLRIVGTVITDIHAVGTQFVAVFTAQMTYADAMQEFERTFPVRDREERGDAEHTIWFPLKLIAIHRRNRRTQERLFPIDCPDRFDKPDVRLLRFGKSEVQFRFSLRFERATAVLLNRRSPVKRSCGHMQFRFGRLKRRIGDNQLEFRRLSNIEQMERFLCRHVQCEGLPVEYRCRRRSVELVWKNHE